MNSILYIDMQFTRDIDFTVLDYQNFQTIGISNQKISNFNVGYVITSNSSYRISVEPKGYAFIYNDTVTVTTMDPPSPYHTAIDTMQFKPAVYQKIAEETWLLMNSPSMSDMEHSIVNGLSGVNDVLF